MMIPINSASLMKFGELWKNVEISWYFKGPALSAFFYEISQLLWKGSNFTCMFLMMIPINMYCKFDEIWWTLKKCWNFMIFQRAGTVSIFYEISQLLWKGSNFTCMFLMMIPINMYCKFDEIWWPLKKCWNFMIFLGQALSAFFCEKI